MNKKCPKCKKNKKVAEFHKSLSAKSGLQSWCKSCKRNEGKTLTAKIRQQEYYKNNINSIKKYKHNWHIKNRKKILLRVKKYTKENYEEIKAYKKEYRKNNKEKIAADNKKYQQENPEKVNANTRKWAKNNPDKVLASVRKRQLTKTKQTPKWLTEEQLKEIEWFYTTAKELQWLSEEPLEVDHIIPLKAINAKTKEHIACGLHVPWNLQIISASKNRSKGNRIK
jgi:hypothetical protein